MLEKQLQEELNRFNNINKYVKRLLNEQEPPLPPDPTTAPPPGGDVPPPPLGGDMGGAPAPDLGTDTPLVPGEEPVDSMGDETSDEITDNPEEDDTTEELDITDLVNMTKDIKKQIDAASDSKINDGQQMNNVFSKLSELEGKLAQMDSIIAKIDQLGGEVKEMKPKTPVEKLEMRSLDSYPFNKKPDEFFREKQGEMRSSGKNEYVLTKDDVENYGRGQITKTFNPTESNYLN
jgi:hypothetical protein